MKTLVGIPCLEMVHTQFMQSILNLRYPENTEITIASGSLVYDARDTIAGKAVAEGFDQVVMLDSDMIFEPDSIMRLEEHLRNGLDFVSGIYFKRKKPAEPVIYNRMDLSQNEIGYIPSIDSYLDYPKDQLFEIEACGFGLVMMKTEVIKKVQDKFGLPFFPVAGFGEDIAFCYRMKALGIKRYCDSSIKAKHLAYYPVSEETWLKGVF